MADWMIYGATGYTGVLVAEEAVKHGHKPLLVGRSESKLKALAERLNLEYAVAGLEETDKLEKVVGSVQLVYHAAGPFIQTSRPMLLACLKMGTHYLDITGEIPVYMNIFEYGDQVAREKGIVLMPGVGFDVIPSDCLLKYVADQVPDATHLEMALDALSSGDSTTSGLSAGTTKSALAVFPRIGNKVRRNGELEPIGLGVGAKRFRFPTGERTAMPIPWGDLMTAYRTTGVPNITTYLTVPAAAPTVLRLTGWALRALLKIKPVHDFAARQIDKRILGPSEHQRETGRSYVYAQARNAAGQTAEAWLETPEGYQFTALSSIPVIERVLDGNYQGAITPATAFGSDFVLQIPGTHRFDKLPN